MVVDYREATIELIDQNNRPQMRRGLHIGNIDRYSPFAKYFLKMWNQAVEFDLELSRYELYARGYEKSSFRCVADLWDAYQLGQLLYSTLPHQCLTSIQ